MKLQVILSVLPLLLCQCKVANVIGGGPLPGSSAVTSDKKLAVAGSDVNAYSKDVYEQGLRMGRQDHAQGKSPSYGRHVSEFSERTEDAFSAGYEAGFFGSP
jgi:hypothetical protein